MAFLALLLLKPLVISPLLAFTFLVLRTVYRISPLHPLSHIPGPYLPRMSSLWLVYHAWIGDECTVVHKLHQQYGPIVRTGPFSVDIADGEALNDIYVAKGGFRKAAFYGNFDIDGHKSIFSEVIPENRAPRAKAVLPLFATAHLRAGKDVLDSIVQGFVAKCARQAEVSRRTNRPVNLLDLTRGLAVDAVTGYLFGRAYGGLEHERREEGERKADAKAKDEERGEMSANGMVDLFVGVGRFWYLPAWSFQWVDWLDAKFGVGSSKDVDNSLGLVDDFVAGVVENARLALEAAKPDDGGVDGVTRASYPGRLLSAGLSISETQAQCKDLIFAGTDSTGMNLATIVFYLAKHPDIMERLKAELQEKKDVIDLMEIQSFPLLRGVVKEGLRLSMANPSRLPRVVPASGWAFKGIQFPANTEVSCTPFELHLNPEVFEDPCVFDPTRWIDDGAKSKEMERDAIPFGLGPRQCIARNLATAELFLAVKGLVESGVLRGAQPVKDKIEILEWFNSHVIEGKIDMRWV
ncbi:hypothetical protein PMZ80_006449 [Knufia obscura]|uniref:Cytochrome P450 n=2 Tax=Knufia TaxID=430999 RepID=A0AAN8ETK1_9EURO|nr:hypothetical protein PMZ80_006449 [Knufia obscura]KAK5953401.1 hypothetical protein OHC33_005345 [Knufia fluminis]